MNSSLLGMVRRFVGKAGKFAFFSILNRSVPFLLLPILTKYLSPADYGMVSLFSILTLTLMPIIGLNSNTIMLQRYFKSSEIERQQLISSSYAVMILVASIVMLMALLFSGELTSWLKLPLNWLLLAVLAALMGMIFTMFTTLLQIRQEVSRFGLAQLSQTIMNAGLSLLFVVVLGYGWQGRLSGIMVASCAMMLYSVYMNLNRGDIRVPMLLKPENMPHIVQNGLLLLPSSFAGAATAMSDRFLLAPKVSLKELGIYSAAIMICQILDVLYNAIGMAYMPIFFEKYHAESRGERRKAVLSSYAIVCLYLILASLFAIVAPYIVEIMLNERYHSASVFLGWIAFGYAMMASGSLLSNHIIAMENNSLVTAISVVMLVAAVSINYFMIGINGAKGASQALFLSGSFFLVINAFFSFKYNGGFMRVPPEEN